jgi:hypothetical protein
MLLLNHLSGEEDLTKDIFIKSSSCPLCKMFIKAMSFCFDCPIYIKTKISSCQNTPYMNVFDWWEDEPTNFPKGFKVISKELEFLYSLLDEEKD